MKTTIAATLIGAAFVLTACTETGPTFTATPTPAPAPQEPRTLTQTKAPAKPKPADFVITLKTTTKQCFGSAGCNLTVEPHIGTTGDGSVMDGKVCRFIYDIDGGSDGPQTQTMTLRGTQYTSFPVFVSTPKSTTELKATITDVDC